MKLKKRCYCRSFLTSYHFRIGLKICIRSRRRRAPAEDVLAEGSRDGPAVKFRCEILARFSDSLPHGDNGAESVQRKRPLHSGQGPNDPSLVRPSVQRLDFLSLPRPPPGRAPQPQGTLTRGRPGGWAAVRGRTAAGERGHTLCTGRDVAPPAGNCPRGCHPCSLSRPCRWPAPRRWRCRQHALWGFSGAT